MNRALTLALAAAGMLSSAVASAQAVPPAALESTLHTLVIAQADRSVDFGKTLPQVEKPRKPVVDDGEMAKVGEGVYMDRRLMPAAPSQRESGEDALRIFRRDAR